MSGGGAATEPEVAGSGDAGMSGAGVMFMRSAQMMGHAERKSIKNCVF